MISTTDLFGDVPDNHDSSWAWGDGWFHANQDADGITVMSSLDRLVQSTVWVSDLGPLLRHSNFMRIT